jgi:hypothetical protein
LCDPSFDGQYKTVQTGLLFNSLDFGGIKNEVVKLLPYADELNGSGSWGLEISVIYLQDPFAFSDQWFI